MRLRAITRIKNDHIMAELDRRGWNQSDLGREAGVSPWSVSNACNLDYKGLRPLDAAKIAGVLGLDIELVMPNELIGKKVAHVKVQVAELSAAQILTLSAQQDRLLLEAPDDIVADEDERETRMQIVRESLAKLSDVQRFIVERRFGLVDGTEWKFSRIAKKLKMSTSNVQQICARAERHLPFHAKAVEHDRLVDMKLRQMNAQDWRTALRERKAR